MSPYNEAQARLDRLAELWRELERAPKGSHAYEASISRFGLNQMPTTPSLLHTSSKKPGEPND